LRVTISSEILAFLANSYLPAFPEGLKIMFHGLVGEVLAFLPNFYLPAFSDGLKIQVHTLIAVVLTFLANYWLPTILKGLDHHLVLVMEAPASCW
jgi:hypothetical protein